MTAESGTVSRQSEQSKCSEFRSATEGDELYVEFELSYEAGIYGVRGTVSNVTTWTDQDGYTERRVVRVRPTQHSTIEWLGLTGLHQPDGMGFIDGKIELGRHGQRVKEKDDDADIQVIEVECSD